MTALAFKNSMPASAPPLTLETIACIIGSEHHVMKLTPENWNTKTWTVVKSWQRNN